MFANIQKQHARQFGPSTQGTTLTEADIADDKDAEEEKKSEVSKGYGYRRAPQNDETADAEEEKKGQSAQ